MLLGSCVSGPSRDELAAEYFNLGNAWFEAENLTRSQEFYERALELGETLDGARFNLARVYIDQGRYAEARRTLDAIEQTSVDPVLVQETYAWVLYKLGDLAGARTLYAGLLSQAPERTRAAYNLALIELEENRPENAWRAISTAARYAREDREYLWLYAEISYRTGRADAALAAMETIRSLSERVEELYELARGYREWDYNLAALDVLEQAGEEFELPPQAEFLLASIYLLETPDFDAGRSSFRSALESGFDDLSAIGQLLTRLADDEQAILRADARAGGLVLPDTQPNLDTQGSNVDAPADSDRSDAES